MSPEELSTLFEAAQEDFEVENGQTNQGLPRQDPSRSHFHTPYHSVGRGARQSQSRRPRVVNNQVQIDSQRKPGCPQPYKTGGLRPEDLGRRKTCRRPEERDHVESARE